MSDLFDRLFNAYLTKTLSLAPFLTGWLVAIAVFYMMVVIFMLSLQWRLLRDEIWLRATTAYYFLMALWMLCHAFASDLTYFPKLTAVLITGVSISLLLTSYKMIYPEPPKYPHWTSAVLILALVFSLTPSLHPFETLPQALCLGLIFAQCCVNMSTHFSPKKIWQKAFYGMLGLVAFSGFLACSLLGFNESLSLKAIGYSFSDLWALGQGGQVSHNPLYKTKLDGVAFLFLAIPNMVLFLFILFALIKSLLAFTPGDKALRAVTHDNQEFLDSNGKGGLLHALGRMVGAEHVTLALKSPPAEADTIYRWHWFAEHVRAEDVDTSYLYGSTQIINSKLDMIYPYQKDMEDASPITREVFSTGETIAHKSETSPNFRTMIKCLKRVQAFIAIPVRFNGAIIGVLTYEWHSKNAFSRSTIRRLEQMADYLAPLFASHRQLIAQNLLNQDFEDDQITTALSPTHDHLKDKNAIYPKHNIYKSVQTLHHYASPLATLLILSIGFKRRGIIVHNEGIVDHHFTDDGTSCLKSLKETFEETSTHHAYHTTPIHYGGNLEGEEVGSLTFAVARDRDPIDRPTITRDVLAQEALASRLITAVMDDTYIRLSSVIAQLHTRLLRCHTYDAWFDELNTACLSQDILWTTTHLTRAETAKNLSSLPPEQTAILHDFSMKVREEQGTDQALAISQLETPIAGAQVLIYIPLDTSGAVLLLGLEVKDFHRDFELPHSPWQMFLEHLRDIADLALSQIERQELLDATNVLEKEAQLAVVQSLWLHELRNLSVQIIGHSETIEDKLKRNQLERAKELNLESREIAKTFNKIAFRIGQPFELDQKSDFTDLQDVMDRITDHYDELFKQRKIRFHYIIEETAKTPVPFSVNYLAITNLIANSIQAMARRSGEINITIRVIKTHLFYHITDTGPGIPAEKSQEIFKLGFTSKKKGGFGLPGSRAALRRQGGDLWHDDGYDKGAKFIIKVPRYQEDSQT